MCKIHYDILAVVVTYNRIGALKSCIEALRKQTYSKFDILIVDNGSTDGTKEYLQSLNGIIVLFQENLGGAGGFYSGLEYAFNNSYNWIWMMDDDGIPDTEQLRYLVANSHISFMINALVIDIKDSNQLAFKLLKPVPVSKIRESEIVDAFIHPFNGTFISRKLIDQIGYIKKEMFIWGDEKEYMMRAIKNNIIPYTITKAIHYHPREKGLSVYMLPFLKFPCFRLLDKPRHLSHHYYRNLGYIDANYRDKLRSFKIVFMYTVFF